MKTAIDTHKHEGLMRGLRLSEPNDYKDFLPLDCPLLDELLKIVSFIIFTRILICQKQSLSVSLYPLHMELNHWILRV
jgi:hypothetical protein